MTAITALDEIESIVKRELPAKCKCATCEALRAILKVIAEAREKSTPPQTETLP
jgi:hypothetical protein